MGLGTQMMTPGVVLPPRPQQQGAKRTLRQTWTHLCAMSRMAPKVRNLNPEFLSFHFQRWTYQRAMRSNPL